MIFNKKDPIGIVSYGAYIPKYKISGEKIAKSQEKLEQKIYKSLGVESKTVPGVDEDTITISTMAGFQALERLQLLLFPTIVTGVNQLKTDIKSRIKFSDDATQIKEKQKYNIKQDIGALFIGSESHPYAVKPSGTVVAQALGIASDSIDNFEGSGAGKNNLGKIGENRIIKPLALADLQFACKAGTQAIQISSFYVSSGFSKYTMAIGADTAQSKPGDILEYTAGAGGGAIILGREDKIGGKKDTRSKNFRSGQSDQYIIKGKNGTKLLAKLIATTSVATDTPDFWRRPQQSYPEHAGRFTGGPGYFNHISMASKMIMDETGLKPKDFDYCVFHSPNAKFPNSIAKKLGFTDAQIKPSLIVKKIGNTYAGASVLGLISTLDIAKKNKKILVVSYGSGSGSDAFVFETTKYLEEARKIWNQDRQENNSCVVSEFLEDKIKI